MTSLDLFLFKSFGLASAGVLKPIATILPFCTSNLSVVVILDAKKFVEVALYLCWEKKRKLEISYEFYESWECPTTSAISRSSFNFNLMELWETFRLKIESVKSTYATDIEATIVEFLSGLTSLHSLLYIEMTPKFRTSHQKYSIA